MTFLAIWSFIKGLAKAIPWWVWAAFAVLALAYFYGESRYQAGQAERQGLWDKATAAYEAQLRTEKARQAKVEVQTVTEYVYRDREIRVKGDTIIQKVPVYVSSDAPDLPPGWRLLHDAAARNELPEAPGSVQAEPVSAQDAAGTVIENYTVCHAELAKLNGLWEWANGMAGSSSESR
jgi:hypothetical protein